MNTAGELLRYEDLTDQGTVGSRAVVRSACVLTFGAVTQARHFPRGYVVAHSKGQRSGDIPERKTASPPASETRMNCREAPLGCHPLCVESRLHTERASGSTLAGETVADRDSNGLSFDGEPELLATTRGVSSHHERDRRQVGSWDIPEYWPR